MIIKNIEFSATVGSHGELILCSKPQKEEDIITFLGEDSRDTMRKAYSNCDFVTLAKEDAQNIIDMLNEAILKLESGTRTDNDLEVFGNKAISYERLIDRVDGLIYDMK